MKTKTNETEAVQIPLNLIKNVFGLKEEFSGVKMDPASNSLILYGKKETK